MFFKFKKYKCQKYFIQLPKIIQKFSDIKILFNPDNFREIILKNILHAKKRIYIAVLYLENDEAGNCILSALYKAKKKMPKLDINILVDWHRAQRNRFGSDNILTNFDWYRYIASKNPEINIPIYGVPISKRETFGVLHMKGLIVDNTLIYSGANINNEYFYKNKKHRYDRYQLIKNKQLTNSMVSWIKTNIISSQFINFVNDINQDKKIIFNKIKKFKKILRCSEYKFIGNASNYDLSITPLIGLGKKSKLNKTIDNLILCTEKKLIICTPYFNLPKRLIRKINYLLKQNINVEIIVCDKTCNDFFITNNKPFNVIGTIPYFYEINLFDFFNRLKSFIKNKKLIIRIWKKKENSFHLKGMWVDKKWILITGNNFNLRAWKLDLENGILIHDPLKLLVKKFNLELNLIRKNTKILKNINDLESIDDYPTEIQRIFKKLKKVRIDKLISYVI